MIHHKNFVFDGSLKALKTAFEKKIVLHFYEATKKRTPLGSLCIFGVQYIFGRGLSFPSRFKPNLLEKEIFLWFYPLIG